MILKVVHFLGILTITSSVTYNDVRVNNANQFGYGAVSVHDEFFNGIDRVALSKCATNDRDMTVPVQGNELRLKRSVHRRDIYGNCHSRFDQYYNGVRVVGNQVIYHKRNAGEAVHVPPKGNWTQPHEAGSDPMEVFFLCVREEKGKAPVPNPQLSNEQFQRVQDCVKAGGPQFRPDGWNPQANDFLTGLFAEGVQNDVGTFNPAQFNVADKIEEIKKKLGDGGFTVVERDNLTEGELVIFVDVNDNNKGKLAYKVIVVAYDNQVGRFTRPEFYIDAKTGENLDETESLYEVEYSEQGTGPGGNGKIGRKQYGRDREKLLVAIDGNKCSFDTPYVKTITLRGSNDVYASETAHSFNCFESSGDQANGGFSPLNDAHYYATKTLKMYAQWFGDEHPAVPLPLLIKTHLGKWSGHFDGRQLVFGDQKPNAFPATSAIIVAHEIGHIVTFYASKLRYAGASGALNEAFSDWAGKALEYYMNNNRVNNWKIGSDVLRSGQLRCLDNPPCDGKSVDHVSKFRNGMKVHESSGIFNKAFHAMATKMKHKVWDVFDILYQANAHYWQENETFEGGAESVLQAAEDCKNGASNAGSHWLNVQDAADAFKIVGINCNKVGQWKCTK